LKYYKALDTANKVPFPAVVFGKFIKDLYQENLLAKGKFMINGRAADLKNITCPVLNLHAQFDHVFPEKSAKSLNDLVSGPVEYHVMPTGHVTCVVMFPEREQTYKMIRSFFQ
jgi:polyhydroxyalkanoate synthase